MTSDAADDVLIEAREPSSTGAVRRAAARLGERAGLDAEALARLALVCSEASENLVRHGGGGEVLIAARGAAVELLALDRGPGIANLEGAFVDGASGAGTAGFGLGSLRRQADDFDVHSAPGRGTAVLARVRRRAGGRRGDASPASAVAALDVGAVRVARRGESRCGDGWRDRSGPGARRALCLVDGVGHGDGAADAADAALAAFDAAAPDANAAERLAAMDAASRATRGAVGAVALCAPRYAGAGAGPSGVGGGSSEVDVEHAGAGNAATFTLDPGGERRRLYAADGTLGRASPGRGAARTNRCALAPGALLVMHSDGLELPDGPDTGGGLLRREPTLIAAVLYRDHGRRAADDCAVLVARAPAPTRRTAS